MDDQSPYAALLNGIPEIIPGRPRVLSPRDALVNKLPNLSQAAIAHVLPEIPELSVNRLLVRADPCVNGSLAFAHERYPRYSQRCRLTIPVAVADHSVKRATWAEVGGKQ